MRRDEFNGLLERQPFQPFKLHLTGGMTFDVRHPELAILGQASVLLRVPRHELPLPLAMRRVIVVLIHIVYVDFIETAPWNAKEYTSTPLYKGVGVRLIQAAARLSIDEGFAGRVGLHTLPQSAGFYANACEMASLGIDSNNLEYLELTAAKAAVLLKK